MKQKLLKLMCLLCVSMMGMSAWGTEGTLTLSSSKKFGTTAGSTLTDTQSNTWTVTVSGGTGGIQNAYNTSYKGQQFGTSSTQNLNFHFTANYTGYIVTQVDVTAAAGNDKPEYEITVGGTSWATGNLSKTSTKYTATGSGSGDVVVTLKQGTALKAMYLGEIKVTYTKSATPTCVSPTFSVAEGTYGSAQSVTLSTTTEGATIYYTTNGDEPTTSSSVYSSAISVSTTTTIKAIAVKAGMDNSSVASATYTILAIEDGIFNFTYGVIDYGSGLTPKDNAGYNNGGSYETTDATWTAGKVTLVTSGKYRWWITNTGDEIRMYSNDGEQSALTLSVPSGYVITKVDFDSNAALSADKGTYTNGSWSGEEKSVAFEWAASSGTVKIQTITVTYTNKYTLAVSASGYATYYNSKCAYTIPAGLTGYAITAAAGDQLTTTEYAAGTVVPAGEALVLKGAQGNYDLIFTTTDVTPNASNLLKGSDAAETPTADGKYYMLSYDETGANVGFYWGEDNGAAFENGAHKAYLLLPVATPVKGFRFDFDEVTAITELTEKTEATEGVIYNLNGQQLSAPQRGINIIGGKKVLVK